MGDYADRFGVGHNFTPNQLAKAGSHLDWKLTKRDGTTLLQTTDDWIKARALVVRHTGEGDLAYRLRAWTVYTGQQIVDWESTL